MAENLILTGPDGTEYTFPGVSRVSIRKDGGGRAEYGSGGGGSGVTLGEFISSSAITEDLDITAQDLSGLTDVGECAFYGKTFRSITLPETVESIEYYAFTHCTTADGKIVLPNSLKYILPTAFYESYFSTVEIGTGILEIFGGAFEDAYVETLIVRAPAPPSLGANVFAGSYLLKIQVPAGSVSAYQAAPGWNTYSSIITAIP